MYWEKAAEGSIYWVIQPNWEEISYILPHFQEILGVDGHITLSYSIDYLISKKYWMKIDEKDLSLKKGFNKLFN